ncbi:MAG TPA: response regulator [Nitrospiria bacterium]
MDKRYCPACADTVQTEQVLGMGGLDLACKFCGLVIETQEQKEEVAAEADKAAGDPSSLVGQMETAAETAMSVQAPKVDPNAPPALETILMADDSQMIRDLLSEVINGIRITKNLHSFENGAEFIKTFTKNLTAKQPPNIVILDLEMPVMDGVTAARMMRAQEAQHNAPKVPIVFFSAKKIDEKLRSQLDQCNPASYLNKGNDMSPELLSGRIYQVIQAALKKAAASS